MPEGNRRIASQRPPISEGRGRQDTRIWRPDTIGWDRESHLAEERLSLILVAAAAGIASIQVVLYFQSGAWQPLMAAAIVGVSLLLMLTAYGLLRRGRPALAALCVFFGLLIAYGGGELVLAGTTWYFAAGGILVILLAGRVFLPHRWQIWFAAAALHGIIIFLVNWLEPIPRYDAMQLTLLNTQLPAITALLALFALWQLFRALEGVGTIRNRLIIAFVVVVLLPVIAISVGVAVAGAQSVQQQVRNQLDSVAVLKAAQINTWLDDLQIDLNVMLSGPQLPAQVSTTGKEVPGSVEYQQAVEQLRDRLLQTLEQTGRYDELFILDLQGVAIASTDAGEQGKTHSNQSYFREGLEGPYIQPPQSTLTGRTSVTIGHPIRDGEGNVLGVLAGRASLERLDEIMAGRTGLGETGETYLVGANHTLLTHNRRGAVNVWLSTPGIDAAIEQKAAGSSLYDNYEGEPVVGAYRWLPGLQAALIAEQEQAEAIQNIYLTLVIVAGAALLSVLVAVGAALAITRSIATPLASLAETTTKIAAGDLSRTTGLETEDEVGTLAQAFDSMTDQLRGLVGSLEQRVADRTQDLEQRSAYLEAASDVGRAAASILDPEQLMEQTVALLQERFGLYYVGLFLSDEKGEWAVLRANAGRTGRPLPSRGERLEIGTGSMIGWCIAHAQARIALEASEDEQRLARAELPETRSEAALPLRSRGEVIGALTVQHTEPNAFDEGTIIVLQTAADLIGVALDNARLLAQRQEALEETQRAYGELSQQAWREMLRSTSAPAYRSDEQGVSDASDVWRPEMEKALQTGQTVQGDGGGGGPEDKRLLAVPIKVRGEIVGVLDTYKPVGAGGWTSDEVLLLETIADRMGDALESARLYQDTQRRAAREQAIRQVTERMRRAVDVEAILQDTVTGLAKALGAPRAYVRLGTEAQLRSGGSPARQTDTPTAVSENGEGDPDEA